MIRFRKFLSAAALLFVVLGSSPVYAVADQQSMLVNAIKGNTIEVKDKRVFHTQFLRIAGRYGDIANTGVVTLDEPHAYYCSGFIQDLYRQNGIWLPAASVAHQAKFGERVEKLSQVEPGDLVFLSAKTSDKIPAHVAVALDAGQLLHASGANRHVSKIPVTPEIKQHFMFARRLISSV